MAIVMVESGLGEVSKVEFLQGSVIVTEKFCVITADGNFCI